MRESVAHDVSWAAALSIVEAMQQAASAEEKFTEAYIRLKLALEIYDQRIDRIESRLRPSGNKEGVNQWASSERS